MIFSDFFGRRKPPERLADDRGALQQMRLKHGDNMRPELERRASDPKLSARDRRHWRRLLVRAQNNGF